MSKNDFLSSISATLILDTMAEGVMLIDLEGKIKIWNKAMCEITGYNAIEILDHTTERLKAPECVGANQITALLRKSGEIDQCITGCECRMVAKNGEHIPVMVNARVLREKNGKTLGILQTVTDFRPIFNLRQEIAAMASRLQSEESFQGITGKSSLMRNVFRLIKLAADSEASVIVLGESGTGKELVADAIQQLGERKGKPFIKVNCGAIPETLLESELFGHEKGSFTGAIKQRTGRFEGADGGTIFLDEIGDISSAMQVKLLRVLQNGEIQRVGGEKTLKVNVRIIAATNKDLLKEVKEGRFREDLYYRLRVFPINLPALRQRPEDIPILAQHLVNRFSARTGRLISGITREAMNRLVSHSWPGNVRELENAIEYAFVVCQKRLIDAEDLPMDLVIEPEKLPSRIIDSPGNSSLHQAAIDKIEGKRIIRSPLLLQKLLEDCLWNKAEAGRRLGLSRTAIWKWMVKHKITSPV